MATDKFGLRPLVEDKRDFELGRFMKLPDLSELPETFELEGSIIKNQGGTDFCSSYASTGMSELQEGVELNPDYSFAISKKISGNPESWGQNMRDAMKAHAEFGALEQIDYDTELSNDDKRYINKYPHKYYELAEKHLKKSYVKPKGQYDAYDNIRASIWHFRAQRQAVAIGVVFSWSLNQYILSGTQDSGFGHMMYVNGWDSDGLIITNSYGINTGKDGKHRMTRETINHFVSRYGAFMLIDMPPREVKDQIERADWFRASWWTKLVILFKRLWE